MFLAQIVVQLKPDVMDPQGQAVQEAAQRIGFHEVREVRAGRYFSLKVEADDADRAREQVTELCRKLLANPIIETFTVSIQPLEQSGA